MIAAGNVMTDHLFLNVMQGETGKMSASDPNSAIYVTDSAKVIKSKVWPWKGHIAPFMLVCAHGVLLAYRVD
jgi:tryptophanyl-tRNA synthetase